jgi:hypothetical protein
MPPLPAAVVAGMNGAQPNLDVSAAAYVGGTYPTWVVPGSTEVCLVVGANGPDNVPSSVCGPVSRAEAGMALVTGSGPGGQSVVGLAPDGNATVKVTNTDGTTENVPVKNNVYEIIDGKQNTVSLKEASGAMTQRPLVVPTGP